jgi:hypothetical protein
MPSAQRSFWIALALARASGGCRRNLELMARRRGMCIGPDVPDNAVKYGREGLRQRKSTRKGKRT